MSLPDLHGFADPIDYEKYGPHTRFMTPEGLPDPAFRDHFRGRISTDGSSEFAAESGRYHLYLALGCPYAHRASIIVSLLGLDDVISRSYLDDVRDGRGWAFRERRGKDPVNDFSMLKQAYVASKPDFHGRVSVPVLWDRKTACIVNNADDDIFADVATQFGAFASNPVDLYPSDRRTEIDVLDAEICENINTGVYAIAQSRTQEEYDTRVKRTFDTLDRLEERLGSRRYLFGGAITQTDIRLWVTLARFDTVYNPFFRASLRRLQDYPNLWAYTRDLYSLPAFSGTSDFEAIKRTYYLDFPLRNPLGLIPAGPAIDWDEPQHRATLSG